jgi:G3E family GTPase
MKGLLNIAGEERPVAVHGVQHLFHPPAQLDAWPDGDRRSRLVLIVRDVERAFFERTLASFNEGPGALAPAAGA